MKLHKDWIIVAIGLASIVTVIEANATDVWYNGSTMDFNTYTRESAQDFQIQQLQQQQQYDSYRDTTDSYGRGNVYEHKGFAPSRLYDTPSPLDTWR